MAVIDDGPTDPQDSVRFRWRIAEPDGPSCALDSWVSGALVERIVVVCDDSILYDSEDAVGYGAWLPDAVLTEYPQALRSADRHRYGYEPEPRRFQYHLRINALESEGTELALDTEAGWLSLRPGSMLHRDRKWIVRETSTERAGTPLLLHPEFGGDSAMVRVRLDEPLGDPSVPEGTLCILDSRLHSVNTLGEATCSSTMECQSVVVFEDLVGPCEVNQTGKPSEIAHLHPDGSPHLVARVADKELELRPSPGDEPIAIVRTGPIGIPECDEYIRKYARCIEEMTPEAAREQTRRALERSIDAWTQAAAGPGVETLGETCSYALETARRATAAMGCRW